MEEFAGVAAVAVGRYILLDLLEGSGREVSERKQAVEVELVDKLSLSFLKGAAS